MEATKQVWFGQSDPDRGIELEFGSQNVENIQPNLLAAGQGVVGMCVRGSSI